MPGAAQWSPHKPGSCQALMGGSPGQRQGCSKQRTVRGRVRVCWPQAGPPQPSCLNVSLFLSYLFPLRSFLSWILEVTKFPLSFPVVPQFFFLSF